MAKGTLGGSIRRSRTPGRLIDAAHHSRARDVREAGSTIAAQIAQMRANRSHAFRGTKRNLSASFTKAFRKSDPLGAVRLVRFDAAL